MSALSEDLEDRINGFTEHAALASEMENSLLDSDESFSIGSLTLQARHVSTIKSGLIVHCYNIEEAIMSRIGDRLGEAIASSEPLRWTDDTLGSWLRGRIKNLNEVKEEGRIKTTTRLSREVLGQIERAPLRPKKPSGTWDDELIFEYAKRLGVHIVLPAALHRKLGVAKADLGRTQLRYIADERNALAHGEKTFEEAARSRQVTFLSETAEVVFEFLKFTIAAFETHIDQSRYLVVEE